MELAFALRLAMMVTALSGAGLAALLLWRARSAAGALPLAAFLLLVGVWALGLVFPDHGDGALMALAPLGGAAFVHFAVRLSAHEARLIRPAWGIGLATTAIALIHPGAFVAWNGATLFRYGGTGWAAVAATLILATLGHWLLLRAWRTSGDKRRRQIGVVMTSSLLGLCAVSTLALPVLEIEAAPWPLLVLPVYVVVLATGVLRYELMDVNLWTRRALTWAILMVAATTMTAVPAGLTMAGTSWAVAAVAVAVALALWLPVQRAVDALVFPGGDVAAATIESWRMALEDTEDIDACAADLLGKHLRLPLGSPLPSWQDAPPGPRRAFYLMETIKATTRRELERRRAFAERQRLAELGALAATVAHDLRNPMNIVAMAVADAEPSTRSEVKAQLARMEALVRDLLDYAKPWAVTPTKVNMAEVVAATLQGRAEQIDIPADLTLRADPLRLAQALDNLLTNAAGTGGRVRVAAERNAEGVLIHVYDNGPGIPADIRASLFQPFVSRSPGGTGLGLAIVAKVMAAHGGSVALTERPGWTSCFTLRFPS